MLEKKRILVVEDDSGVARLLHDSLVLAGYEVTLVPDGHAALLVFDEARPDLVTLDLMLPRVTGFRLVELFKHLRPDLPVIIISGLAFEEAEETAVSRVDDYLVKPFSVDVLLDTVQYHLDRAEMSRIRDMPVSRSPVLAPA